MGLPQKGNGIVCRVVIVDDHPIVRAGLASLIDSESDLSVCGQAEDAREALGKGEEFTNAWSELRPSSITDEWMAFFFKANPEWYNRLNDLWIAKDWKERWLGDWEPETLGEGSKD